MSVGPEDCRVHFRRERNGADRRRTTRARHVVSLNPKLGRGPFLHRAIYQEMERDTVRSSIDPRAGIPGRQVTLTIFGSGPCKEGERGSKKLHRTGETRMLSAKMLLTRLGKDKGKGSVRYPARWDSPHNALVVNVSQPA